MMNKGKPYFMKQIAQASTLCLLLSAFSVETKAEISLGIESGVVTNDLVLQSKKVTGVVLDASNIPVIGANVIVKGTTNGTITDMDGRFSLQDVPENSVIKISYIGYLDQEISVSGKSSFEVLLKEDTQKLDEVVVVGYGTQAKKDITGSVAVVSTDDLKETPVSNFAEALQGKAAGVFVQAGGGPLGETTIRIRGVGSVNGSDPLVIVDGISGVDIDAVNPNDIESMQILKDAAASAVYGAKGANGVIIITTKQGKKNDKVKVSYNGYFGYAKMANDGYGLLNAWEAMEFQEEGQRNLLEFRGLTTTHSQFGSIGPDGKGHLTMPYAIKPNGLSKEQIIERFGSIAAWEASYKDDGSNSWSRSAYYQMLEDGYSEAEARKGTDWLKEVTQVGKVQDHQVSIVGGGEKATYSASLGYMSREGTIKNSFFRRYSLRTNTNFYVNKYFNIGQNTNIAIIENGGERGRQGDYNVFGKSYSIQPWVPIYNIGGDFAGSQANEGGRAESAVQQVENEKDNLRRFFRAQSAVYAELMPFEGLKLRSQFSARLNGYWDYWMNKRTIMTNKEGSNNNQFNEQANFWFGWQWTNTATYEKTINDDHKINVVLGTEAIKEGIGRQIGGSRIDYPFEDNPNTWILNNGSTANMNNWGSFMSKSTMFGIFGRADYSYKGKYLATVTVRRDASSKFSANNRWGTFPSVSLGWRISDESFMERVKGSWLDDLKVRAGYGTTGNSNIAAYNWAFQYGTGNNYLYSISGADTEVFAGFGVTNLGDIEAKWETSKMFNVGFDMTAFNNRFNANFDYYIKKTSDMLIDANWSALAGGASKPKVNIGDMENRGIDLNLMWRDKIGQVGYTVGLNLSHYKNKLLDIGTDAGIFEGSRISNTNVMMKGYAIGMFHGYVTDGIYKSEEEVLNYKNDKGGIVLPYGADADNMNPATYVGQYKIKDVNGDGKITAEDRTFIGNPHPDLTGGFNLSLNWNGFDLGTYMYFSIGNDIFALYKYYTHYGSLQSSYSIDRRDNSWHPVKNPDGIYPLWATASGESTIAANESNSSYIEDGSYLRMQTLTLGYTLPKNILKKIGFEKIRIYGQLSNVFTLTGYSGLDPEVRTDDGGGGSKDRNMGTDYGSYGMPRQFIMGLNVTF
ncbi:MAG: TonB-dependent receptor [Parabacteroides sp.]|nr:TonB-dependent receptor [Parabacteroides sp.]